MSNKDKNVQNSSSNMEDKDLDSVNEIHVFVDVLNLLSRERDGKDILNEENESTDSGQQDGDQQKARSSECSSSKNKKKREKFDSGLGDEIVENHDPSDDDDDHNSKIGKAKWKYPTSDDFSSSDDDEQVEKRQKRSSKTENGTHSFLKCRRTESGVHRVTADSSNENEGEEEMKTDNEMRMYESPYTELMKSRIQELPLPPILKKYLSFYREF